MVDIEQLSDPIILDVLTKSRYGRKNQISMQKYIADELSKVYGQQQDLLGAVIVPHPDYDSMLRRAIDLSIVKGEINALERVLAKTRAFFDASGSAIPKD